MRRLIHIWPLIAGGLFLALVMVLLVGDVVDSYNQERNIQIVESRGLEELDGVSPTDLSLLEQSRDGFAHIVNAFSYYYNQCGYYDNTLSYLPVQNGRVHEKGLYCAFFVLYLVLALLMTVSLIVWKHVLLCYVISGALLAMVLIVGKSPDYVHLVLLVSGWIYLNLAGNLVRLKGSKKIKEFWNDFPVGIFSVYGVLALFMFSLSFLVPNSVLPEASKDTKDMIFEKLQEIQLVSSQYEENKRKKMEETQRLQGEENENTEEEDQRNRKEDEHNTGIEQQNPDFAAEDDPFTGNSEDDPFTGNSGDDPEGGNLTNGNRSDENQSDGNLSKGNALTEDSSSEREMGIWGSLTEMLGFSGSGETGLGFSLRSGGGISGGRTDQTGNLSFSGNTVMRAYADFKPEETMYIRLFYGEDYEDSRWKQTEKEHFDDLPVVFRSVIIDYDGDGRQDQVLNSDDTLKENEVLQLTMPTFYGLNSGKLNEQAENEFVQIEYSNKLSKGQTFGSSRLASTGYPEKDSYLMNVCREVPKDLHELFAAEFSDVLKLDLNSFSRMEVANKIGQSLEETAYYTLSPGKAPGNKDFITWFLTENKRGYCMHFASAGVMMLREVGVSARYAEGYSVSASAWTQQEDGRWCAEVKDSNAHAWAEIYSGVGVSDGYWIPVELTPAYHGELAGSFAGQPDMYVGRTVIPGVIVKILKMILGGICAAILAVTGWIFYRKGKIRYEKRLVHTGDRKQDVRNMMKLLLRKASRKNWKLQSIMKQENLTLEEFKKQIPALVPEFGQDAETSEWFGQFSDYAYQAAFGAAISRQDRKEALHLYRKLRCKLYQKQTKKEHNNNSLS